MVPVTAPVWKKLRGEILTEAGVRTAGVIQGADPPPGVWSAPAQVAALAGRSCGRRGCALPGVRMSGFDAGADGSGAVAVVDLCGH